MPPWVRPPVSRLPLLLWRRGWGEEALYPLSDASRFLVAEVPELPEVISSQAVLRVEPEGLGELLFSLIHSTELKKSDSQVQMRHGMIRLETQDLLELAERLLILAIESQFLRQ